MRETPIGDCRRSESARGSEDNEAANGVGSIVRQRLAGG